MLERGCRGADRKTSTPPIEDLVRPAGLVALLGGQGEQFRESSGLALLSSELLAFARFFLAQLLQVALEVEDAAFFRLEDVSADWADGLRLE